MTNPRRSNADFLTPRLCIFEPYTRTARAVTEVSTWNVWTFCQQHAHLHGTQSVSQLCVSSALHATALSLAFKICERYLERDTARFCCMFVGIDIKWASAPGYNATWQRLNSRVQWHSRCACMETTASSMSENSSIKYKWITVHKCAYTMYLNLNYCACERCTGVNLTRINDITIYVNKLRGSVSLMRRI